MTAQDLYTTSVRALAPAERFRLVALILDELTRARVLPAASDSADSWAEQDQDELTSFSLSYAEAIYPEDEELV